MTNNTPSESNQENQDLDQAARNARAASLRKEIDDLCKGRTVPFTMPPSPEVLDAIAQSVIDALLADDLDLAEKIFKEQTAEMISPHEIAMRINNSLSCIRFKLTTSPRVCTDAQIAQGFGLVDQTVIMQLTDNDTELGELRRFTYARKVIIATAL